MIPLPRVMQETWNHTCKVLDKTQHDCPMVNPKRELSCSHSVTSQSVLTLPSVRQFFTVPWPHECCSVARGSGSCPVSGTCLLLCAEAPAWIWWYQWSLKQDPHYSTEVYFVGISFVCFQVPASMCCWTPLFLLGRGHSWMQSGCHSNMGFRVQQTGVQIPIQVLPHFGT